MYNIVYSVIFHQSIDYVNHFLKNIDKYNIKNNYLVIIHLSDNLYEQKDKLYKKKVIINPIHYNKQTKTHLIMKAFIENFEYLISQKISFANFMTLTSSNRLVKQAPKFKLPNMQLCENKIIQNINDLNNWHWPRFLRNKKFVKIFQDNKIKLISGQVSGRLYTKNVMEKICEFIRVNKIFDLIQKETYFEEIILPSLANYYMNNQKVYCHVFWDNHRSIPKVDDVKQILKEKPHIFIIKRFPNNLNHILYKADFT